MPTPRCSTFLKGQSLKGNLVTDEERWVGKGKTIYGERNELQGGQGELYAIYIVSCPHDNLALTIRHEIPVLWLDRP